MVLLNTSELHAENGNLPQAVVLARKAYELAPDLSETQLCYADKLHKSGHLTIIPDVVKLASSPYRKEKEKLYIAGMEARINALDARKSPEKLRSLCESLLRLDNHNPTAIAGLQKAREILFNKLTPEQQKSSQRK